MDASRNLLRPVGELVGRIAGENVNFMAERAQRTQVLPVSNIAAPNVDRRRIALKAKLRDPLPRAV